MEDAELPQEPCFEFPTRKRCFEWRNRLEISAEGILRRRRLSEPRDCHLAESIMDHVLANKLSLNSLHRTSRSWIR